MILNKPQIDLLGVDKLTTEPVINITSPEGPFKTGTDTSVGVSLVFGDVAAMREFARQITRACAAIERGELEEDLQPCV